MRRTHQTKRMKNKTLFPFGMLMICLTILPFTTLADLKSNTERLNQLMDQLHLGRIERERQVQLERERQVQLERERQVQLERERQV